MGALSQLVTNAVATAKKVTASLQIVIQYERFTGDEKEQENIVGRRMYADPVEYSVVMESRTRFVAVDDGVQSVQISSIQFLDPIPITVRDRITLPDGSRPQIAAIDGTPNPDGIYYAPRVVF